MSEFTVRFVDGHDLRYKTFCTEAKTKFDAITNLRNEYGDFDHRIVVIYRDDVLVWEE